MKYSKNISGKEDKNYGDVSVKVLGDATFSAGTGGLAIRGNLKGVDVKDFYFKTLQTNRSTYVLVPWRVSWKDAMNFAEKYGGHLVTVTSEDEQLAIEELLTASGFDDGKFFWLGASDFNSENKFKWVTGEEWNYENWQNAQPDNSGDVEHYLGTTLGYQWNDWSESDGRITGFIIEFDRD